MEFLSNSKYRVFTTHPAGDHRRQTVKTQSIRGRMPRDIIRRYGHGSTGILERIILQQGIPVIQVRMNFVEYFTRIYDRRELYKRLLVGESLDVLCAYSRTSRGSTVSSGATRVLVMKSTLLLSKGLTLTNSYLI